MPMKLVNNVLTVVLPSHQAQKLTQIAEDRGASVSKLINEILGPLLAEDEDESDGRWVLLRVDEDAYRTYLAFFEGDVGFALQSMGSSVEIDAKGFADVLKRTEGKFRQGQA
jgi:hypothetical protein